MTNYLPNQYFSLSSHNNKRTESIFNIAQHYYQN